MQRKMMISLAVLAVMAMCLSACGEAEMVVGDEVGMDIRVTLTAMSGIAQIKEGSFEFEGALRNYQVYLPEGYDRGSSYPVVIYFHSYGWTPVDGMSYTNLNQVADEYGFIAAYPWAIENWNSGVGDNPNTPTPDVNDVGFIDEMIDELDERFSIDLGRVYATGFSNGGFMAYKVACQLSEQIAAVAVVSGLMAESTAADCSPTRPVPVLYFHGTDDRIVPFDGGRGWLSVEESLGYWIDENACQDAETITLEDVDPEDGCLVEKTIYANCLGGSEVVFYKIVTGGHTWPGGSFENLGVTNRDVNASVELWKFFEKYELGGE